MDHQNIHWENVDKSDDHMTLKRWEECCDSGGFIDYDGFGELAGKNIKSNIIIKPSDYTKDNYTAKAILFDRVLDKTYKEVIKEFKITHIVWYNG